jgi:hypothetical protein
MSFLFKVTRILDRHGFKVQKSRPDPSILFLSAALLFSAAGAALSQPVDFGVGVDFAPGSGGEEVKKSTAVVRSVLVDRIAAKLNKDPIKLQKLWRRGYGYVELIKLSLISNESGQPFETIIEQREKNNKLSSIVKKYQLNYSGIFRRSYEIKSELEAEVTDYYYVDESTNAAVSEGVRRGGHSGAPGAKPAAR